MVEGMGDENGMVFVESKTRAPVFLSAGEDNAYYGIPVNGGFMPSGNVIGSLGRNPQQQLGISPTAAIEVHNVRCQPWPLVTAGPLCDLSRASSGRGVHDIQFCQCQKNE